MKKLSNLIAALLVLVTAMPAFAAQVRVYVAEVNAVGVQNKDEMKLTVQTLLASRLNDDRIMAVGGAAEADVLVTGTYVMIGKVFSVDALARTTAGRTLARSFVQGEGQDELMPAITKLAEKLSAEIAKVYAAGKLAPTAAPLKSGIVTAPASDIIKTEQQNRQTPTGDIIRPQEFVQGAPGSWVSKRLEGASNLMAIGATLPDGGREIFLAEDRRIACYRQGSEVKLVASVELGLGEKIISLDAFGPDIFVTVMRGDDLASQVWQMQGGKLVQVAKNLPWYFRTFALGGGQKKLYVQSLGADADFYGDIFEATRNGSQIIVKNPIKMPRYGNLYGFNQFKTSDGTLLTVVISPDGYLVVYDREQNEIWRSNDKFGGSELFFEREDLDNVRITGSKTRPVFMNQKIQVTSKNEVLVGKNEGLWVLGNARSYKKGAVYCLAWNGSSLEEKWRTKDTQNYMPDYGFDEARNELLLLQTVQRPGITGGRGASSLAIKKVE